MTTVVQQSVTLPAHPDFEPLANRSIASLRLAIELFNRPDDQGRTEGVLIFLHHAFELSLKAFLVQRTGSAQDEERGYSFGFDKCLTMCTHELTLLSKDDRCFLSMLDNLRDSAVHYYQSVSEDLLYVFAQGAVTLFDRVILEVTGTALKDRLPSRVLPLCARPPKDLQILIDEEFEALRSAIRDSDLTQSEAVAALRPLIAFSIAAEEKHRRASNAELLEAVERLQVSENWRVVFPQIAQFRFSTDGEGAAIGLKIVKDGHNLMPVRVVKPGEAIDPEGTVIIKEVNLFDKFTMGLRQLSEKLDVSPAKALALIRELKIQDDSEAFRFIKIGKQEHKRYSKRALDLCRENLGRLDAAWEKHRQALKKRKPR